MQVDDGVVRRLEAVSLRDQALSVVRQALDSGEIRPGEIYSAAALAVQLGVSNSPVREAMLTLVHEGLMEPVRNRGFRLVPIDKHDLGEIYELRVLLEVASIEKIAALRLLKSEGTLHAIVEEGELAASRGDLAEFQRIDRQFHLEVLGLLGNHRLVAYVSNLRNQTRLYGLRPFDRQGPLRVSAKEHRELLRSLAAGDPDAARRAMLSHLDHVRPANDATHRSGTDISENHVNGPQ